MSLAELADLRALEAITAINVLGQRILEQEIAPETHAELDEFRRASDEALEHFKKITEGDTFERVFDWLRDLRAGADMRRRN